MTSAQAAPGDFATKGDLELLRRDLQHTEGQLRHEVRLSEERLRSEMHQMETRLTRWTAGMLLTGMGIAAAIGAAIATAIAQVLN